MKIKLLETAGWYTVFKNLRQSYSLDSRSDLNYDLDVRPNFHYFNENNPTNHVLINKSILSINPKDLQLLSTLVKKGDSHSKIIRGIQTYVEITAPRYWWHEWLTYVVGVLEINPTIDWVSLNSESTMHTLLKEDINVDSFNWIDEHHLNEVVKTINRIKDFKYDKNNELKLIKNTLPEGYLQTRTFQISYQAWRRIYQQRYDHKLEEWSKDIIEFIESLPFAKELITIKNDNKSEQ